MNTGLPRQVTVTLWPSAIGARSTSVEASARTSAEGFMVSISGQATQAAPTTPIPVAARYKKSRRVSPESAGAEVAIRSEEQTSELQSLMSISYAALCLKKKKKIILHRLYREYNL